MKILYYVLSLFAYIAPIRCVVCWVLWSYICKEHEKYLLWYPTCCFHCGTPTTHTENCGEHQADGAHGLSGVLVWFYYTHLVKYIIHKAKYWWSYHLFTYFAKKLALLIQIHLISLYKPLVITYIPMHPRKEFYQRGYNQAQKLAEYVALELNVPCFPLLTKTQTTTAQMKKSRKDRQKQSLHVFKILPQVIPVDAIILLVDDVVTTWSTILSASSVIKEHFPNNTIWWVCVARNK